MTKTGAREDNRETDRNADEPKDRNADLREGQERLPTEQEEHMGRCTLCGGKVAGNGKCTECGWDNTKNDKKYRLNVHNEKSKLFQHRDCEDNLNQENWKKRETWQQMLEIGESSERPKRASEQKKASKPVRKENVLEAKGKNVSSQQKKIVKKRQQTGTVKKKKSILVRLVRWIVILSILAELAGAAIPDLVEELGFAFENLVESRDWEHIFSEPEEVWQEETVLEVPEQQNWNQNEAGYVELELQPGFYTAGYEIPAGDYQLECLTESAWVNWWNQGDSYSDYVCLYSKERQESYKELMDRECSYYEVSPVLSLEEGAVLFVEECEGTLMLTGLSDETLIVKEREPQEGLENFVINEFGKVFCAGDSFKAGVYDLVLKSENKNGIAEVQVDLDGRSYYFYLDEDSSSVCRIPMKEETQVTFSYSWNDAEVMLVPSY